MPSLTVAQLAEICGGAVEGDGARIIQGGNSLEAAGPSELSFATGKKGNSLAPDSRAGCLLVDLSFDITGNWSIIRVADPRLAFVRALAALYPPKPHVAFEDSTAVIASTASVAADCFIGAHAVVGEHTRIGSGCYIGNGCVIGDHVSIGPGSTLHANVTIYDGVTIGGRVILHSGCVLGADGFGFTLAGDRYQKFPQIGTVEVGDDVEIGANSCVDRAALGVTRIGTGTKLDNLVHVAHNCVIGQHVVVAAQTGFSGSVVVGDYAVIGGQAGIGEKAKIEARAVVGGKAGILTGQTVRAGEPVWGIPARPLRQHLKGLAHVSKMPELRDQVRKLKQELTNLNAAKPKARD
jgi:UDP-3-O-[3-hydroxymyristoyl] glucosamine N-acyltransferase